MIWEVDDDCDKHVTWPEFQAMFARCRNDKTGATSCCAARRQGSSVAYGTLRRIRAAQAV